MILSYDQLKIELLKIHETLTAGEGRDRTALTIAKSAVYDLTIDIDETVTFLGKSLDEANALIKEQQADAEENDVDKDVPNLAARVARSLLRANTPPATPATEKLAPASAPAKQAVA